jgi:hypothetical protein
MDFFRAPSPFFRNDHKRNETTRTTPVSFLCHKRPTAGLFHPQVVRSIRVIKLLAFNPQEETFHVK